MTAGEANSSPPLIQPRFYQARPLIATGNSGRIPLHPTILTKESHLCSTN